MKRRKRTTTWLVIIVLLVAGAAWSARATGAFAPDESVVVKGATVMRGPLRISVVERGNLKAANSVTLKSELEGNATVLYLIEEGTHVKKGDLVCELDASQLVDRKIQQEIQVYNAYASLTKARQNHEIQESQNLSDIARAERDVEFARLDLEKYLEGERPQEEQSADEEILLRQEEKNRAAQDLEWSEKLAARGFLEQTVLDADRLAKTRTEVAYNQAVRSKELLVTYEIPRRTKELEAEVEESQRELERVNLQAKARIADFVADVETSDAKHRLEKAELEKLESQIAKAVITAPVDGMIVYAVESSHRWGGGTPMQEGSSVRERQEIVTIPSADGYIAEASLHESVLEKVQSRMPCLVTVDALKQTLRGEVGFKAVLPDQNSYFANPDLRVYRTEITILGDDPRMRPGMSCSIEILVDEIEDATYIPVQSVFLDGGSPIALVSSGGSAPEKRSLEVGQNNGKWVQILSGVSEGETVLLSVPASVSLEPATEDSERSRNGDSPVATADAETPSRRPDAGQADRMDPAKIEAWKKANPDKAKALERGRGKGGDASGKHGSGSHAGPVTQ